MAERAQLLPVLELEEFLRWDGGTDTRYEFVGGQVVTMAPPRPQHARMTVPLAAVLERRFMAPGSVYAEAGVRSPGNERDFRVPGLMLSCTQPDIHWIEEPTVIIEIIAPSNDRQDILDKLTFYRTLPSLRQILMVWPERRQIELHAREQDFWAVRTFIGTSTFQLAGADEPITLDEIYRPLRL